jgi:phosphotransferase system enzyme I (PtsI)
MGSNPLHALLLLGLGLDEISVAASSVPIIKKVIRTIRYDQARTWADEALSLGTVGEVDRFLRARAHERLRDFFDSSD